MMVFHLKNLQRKNHDGFSFKKISEEKP